MQDKNRVRADAGDVSLFPAEQGRHVREPGARYFVATVGNLRHRVRAGIDHYRRKAAERRKFGQLLRLNDRLLEDIGLTRGDLIDVQMGVTTLEKLNAARESRRRLLSQQSVSRRFAGQPAGWSADSAEATAPAEKCA